MTPRTLCATSFALLLSGAAMAQGVSLQPADAASVGCDVAGLKDATSVVQELVAEGQLRGAVVMVVRGRSIVLHEAYGARDVRGDKPMRKNSLFRMASNTKAVTAAAVMTLVARGDIRLDDAIAKWFPTFATGDAANITVRHLLTHASGLRINSLFLRPLMKPSKQHPDAPNLVLECARFGGVGPKVKPGTSYRYSNPGYNLLAGLVEVVSKQPFASYCQEHFYGPLGMADSNHHESTADASRMSAVVRGKRDGEWIARWSPGDAPTLPFVRGSGGMISTAMDFAKFCRLWLEDGKVGEQQLLTPELIAAATRDQLPDLEADYGFGWRVHANGSFSHGGSDGTFAWCDPSRDLIGLLFTQTQSPPAIRKRLAAFRERVDAACPPKEEAGR